MPNRNRSTQQYGESRVQKGGNNGTPVNPRPSNLRPKPPSGNAQGQSGGSGNSSGGSDN